MGTRRVQRDGGALRLHFDRRLMLRFSGCVITSSDGGLPAYRELDDGLALTTSGVARDWRMHALARTDSTSWSGCCSSRYSGGWPAMGT